MASAVPGDSGVLSLSVRVWGGSRLPDRSGRGIKGGSPQPLLVTVMRARESPGGLVNPRPHSCPQSPSLASSVNSLISESHLGPVSPETWGYLALLSEGPKFHSRVGHGHRCWLRSCNPGLWNPRRGQRGAQVPISGDLVMGMTRSPHRTQTLGWVLAPYRLNSGL